MDFGIAKTKDLSLTRTGHGRWETPYYMAPEQVLGKRNHERRRRLFLRRVAVRIDDRALARLKSETIESLFFQILNGPRRFGSARARRCPGRRSRA